MNYKHIDSTFATIWRFCIAFIKSHIYIILSLIVIVYYIFSHFFAN